MLPQHRPKQNRKVPWTKEEDEQLKILVQKIGSVNWTLIASQMNTRNSKQCRERWINVLSPDIKCEKWTSEEDSLILQYSQIHGNKWADVSKLLKGRSPNAVKNRFRMLCRKTVNPAQFQQPATLVTTYETYPMPCLLDVTSNQLFYLVPVIQTV